MAVRIEIDVDELDLARREFGETPERMAKAAPRIATNTARRLRTKIAGARGILRQEIRRSIKNRVKLRTATSERDARIWLGAWRVPIEWLKGTRTRRSPRARGVRIAVSRREGVIPRSWQYQIKNPILVERFGDRDDDFRRIMRDVDVYFERARDEAEDEAPKVAALEARKEMAKILD